MVPEAWAHEASAGGRIARGAVAGGAGGESEGREESGEAGDACVHPSLLNPPFGDLQPTIGAAERPRARHIPGTAPSSPSRIDLALSVLNAAVGDYLRARSNGLEIAMGLYHGGVRVEPGAALATDASASGKVCVLIHGLGNNEAIWAFRRDRGRSYGSLLHDDLGFTPLYLRYNTGLHISENGEALASLLEAVVKESPVPVRELALLGYSMGGLVARSACEVARRRGLGWLALVRHVVYLAAPHLGAPLEKAANAVAWALREVGLPQTKVVADVFALRSSGVKDLRHASLHREAWDGVDPDALRRGERIETPFPPGVRHHFVAGSLGPSERHLATRLFGDAMVRVASASARGTGHAPAPSDVRVIPGVHHVGLAHHPAVYELIRGWLGEGEGST